MADIISNSTSRRPGSIDEDPESRSGHWQPARRPHTGDATPADESGRNDHTPSFTPYALDVPGGSRYGQDENDTSLLEDVLNAGNTGSYAEEVEEDQPDPAAAREAEGQISAIASITSPVETTEESGDLSDDEDDERLDPAWGIKRLDSTHILEKIGRTTSFPDDTAVPTPPSHDQTHQLPHSQVESLMQEEDPETRQASESVEANKTQAAYAVDDAASTRRHSDSLFQHDTADSAHTFDFRDEQQSRFEEGEPLMKEDHSSDAPRDTSQAHRMDTYEAGSERRNESAVQAPVLDRKSTSDVLEIFHMENTEPDSPLSKHFGGPQGVDEVQRPNGDMIDYFGKTGEEEKKEDVSALWQAELDDEEFLIEDPDDLLPDSEPGSPSFLDDLKHDQTTTTAAPPEATTRQRNIHHDQRPGYARQSSSNPYTPHQPSTSDLSRFSPTHGNLGLAQARLPQMNSFQQQIQQRPAAPPKAESFVDQSKGGYKSPYDLPMEISKPRKRQSMQPPPAPGKNLPPPPPIRSSSISSDNQLQSPFSPTFPTGPPSARMPSSVPNRSATNPPQSGGIPKSNSTSFFEELPMTSRPRPQSGHGRYTPQQNSVIPPPQLLPRSPPSQSFPPPPAQPSPPRVIQDPYSQYQLRPAEKVDPYANVALQAPPAPTFGAPVTRYSPAPPSTMSAPRTAPFARYSPAPPSQSTPAAGANRYASQPASTSQPNLSSMPPPARYTAQPGPIPPPVAPTLPFQPRTSSPLAYHGKTIEPPPAAERSRSSMLPQRPSASYQNHQPATAVIEASNQSARVGSAPSSALSPTNPAELVPKRPMTQSPSVVRKEFVHRPSSMDENASAMLPPSRPSVTQRGFAADVNFVEPTDGQQHDPLQRWKGAPILRLGLGGTALSTFPKRLPSFGSGYAVKPSAGEVRIHRAGDLLPLPEHVATFPGPLRSKSKKKEVLSWMSKYIAVLEQGNMASIGHLSVPDPRKRHVEKIMLWKIVHALVEHDAVLEGNASVQKSIGAVLAPEVYALNDASVTQYTFGGDAAGIYRPAALSTTADPVDPVAVESLRQHLLRGEREKAVWDAVDKRLWAHAMLIASTLDRSVWKQVIQEFVRQEVKVSGANTESLAAAYEVFGGNFDESIDELVPPSARAGLQLVSKVDSAGPAKNALDGLDKWRETLGLLLNNRTPGDVQALSALGRLLATYGRIEAAHMCHLFARTPQTGGFGGADDPLASIVLVGADHRNQPLSFFQDDDAVLLTEVCEFALSSLANNATFAVPHFQVYKLQRALSLAEHGRTTDAQAYCDAIAGSLKSTTKMSPYYNPSFFAQLEELSNSLRQAPVHGSASWIANPSIDKVKGSVWTKFSSFVAGDDSDADSKASGKEANYESGPFANVTGTPSLSRSESQSDLYGTYPTSMPPSVPTSGAGSRYAPNGLSTARSSSELGRGRASLDAQRPMSSMSAVAHSQLQRPQSFEPRSSFAHLTQPPQPTGSYSPLGQSPPTRSYQATPPQPSYVPNMSQESPPSHYMPQQADAYIPTPPPEPFQTSYMTMPAAPVPQLPPTYTGESYNSYDLPDSHQPATDTFDQETPDATQSYGYEPPSNPGYVPYEPDAEDEMDNQPAQKTTIMDDGDDFPRVSNNTMAPNPNAPSAGVTAEEAARKKANDAAADAAFRAAAEADASREKEKTSKAKASSWFGGVSLFGGKKDANSLDAAPVAKGAEPKVHRANLGESKMKLYYDDKLKKWVNPDNPDAARASATPPPPPRMGGAGRSSTPATNGPPSSPPSRVATPAEASALPPHMQSSDSPPQYSRGPPSSSGPPSATSTPPLPSTGSAPSSRPPTGMSSANSIDDLLGPPMPGAGRKSVKGKKGAKGRYVDIMAK